MMDILVESIEYYYDEDFYVPFDVAITEENNNTNNNIEFQCDNIVKYVDLSSDDDEDDDENDEEFDHNNYDLEDFILSPDMFSQIKLHNPIVNRNRRNQLKLLHFRHSYDNIDQKRPDSNQSAVRMSCSSSSSPISSSSAVTSHNHHQKSTPIFIDPHNLSFNATESIYSLKSRLPLLNADNKNILNNYHLHFAPALIDSSFIDMSVEKSKKSIIDDRSSINDCDPIATTIDCFLKQLCDRHKLPLFQRFTDLFNRKNCTKNDDNGRKSWNNRSILWRQIKFVMRYRYAGWKLMNWLRRYRERAEEETRTSASSSTDEIVFYRTIGRNYLSRKQSYSCSVLELFNSANRCSAKDASEDDRMRLVGMTGRDCDRLTGDKTVKSNRNFCCQFPPLMKKPPLYFNHHHHHQHPVRIIPPQHQTPPSDGANIQKEPAKQNVCDYPGIGRVCLPKPMRLSSSAFLASNLHSHLSFLQESLTNHHSDITSNRDCITGDISNQSPRSLCSLECQKNKMALKPCLRKEDESDSKEEYKEVVCRPRSHKAATDNFKRKSVSFDCPGLTTDNVQELKEIPKKWGLLGSESRLIGDMMAVFECGRRDSLVGASGLSDNCLGNDDATRFRGMVNDVLRAIKQISERLTVAASNGSDKICSLEMNNSFQSQLAVLCEMVSNGDGLESPLATAIDNLIALMSDGLVVTSFSNKKVRISSSSANKAAMRLWLLVEETCRNPGSQNVSRKSELAQLLREVRQIITNISSSKDHQLRLRAFIASALKSGLLHVWIRSVVANETALQRFYCPEAFLRQARSGQSDALAALTVSLKALTSTQSSQTNPSTQTSSSPTKLGLPPPVRISRRFFSSPTTEVSNRIINNHSQKPLYSEDNTESESYADESRSSQSECPPNRDISNNNIFSRATHPRLVKKSNSSHCYSNFTDASRNLSTRNPAKSLTNQNFITSSPSKPSVVSLSLKTVRTQPISSRIKLSKIEK